MHRPYCSFPRCPRRKVITQAALYGTLCLYCTGVFCGKTHFDDHIKASKGICLHPNIRSSTYDDELEELVASLLQPSQRKPTQTVPSLQDDAPHPPTVSVEVLHGDELLASTFVYSAPQASDMWSNEIQPHLHDTRTTVHGYQQTTTTSYALDKEHEYTVGEFWDMINRHTDTDNPWYMVNGRAEDLIGDVGVARLCTSTKELAGNLSHTLPSVFSTTSNNSSGTDFLMGSKGSWTAMHQDVPLYGQSGKLHTVSSSHATTNAPNSECITHIQLTYQCRHLHRQGQQGGADHTTKP
jgi:hypothetical protein